MSRVARAADGDPRSQAAATAGRAIAVVALAFAPLAGCHLIFGYSASESPAVDATLQDGPAKDRLRLDWALLREGTPPGSCSPNSCIAGGSPNGCNAKGEVEPRCSQCGCPNASDRCCIDGRCSLAGHECQIFLKANADAFLAEAAPDQNFGVMPELRLTGGLTYAEEVVLGFPRPDALKSGVTITSAKLWVRVLFGPTPGPTMGVLISNVTEAWTEGTVTFKNVVFPALEFWTIPLVAGDNAVDVRLAVVQWIANARYGFHLQPVTVSLGTTEATIASREHQVADYHPVLHITYK